MGAGVGVGLGVAVGVGVGVGFGVGVGVGAGVPAPRIGLSAASFAVCGVTQSSLTRPPVSPLFGIEGPVVQLMPVRCK